MSEKATESKIDRYENVQIAVEGDDLVIRCNINEDLVDVQPSSSGKTLMLGTTGGARRIPGTSLQLNMSLYRKP